MFAESVKYHFLSTDGGRSPCFTFSWQIYLCFQVQRKHVFLSVVKRTRDFVTGSIVRVGRYLSHCCYKGKFLPVES
ncbi:UNVERIFIED_CONTAM: hypothetical protein NCL1_49862 [Trichonephila clavipes]